MFFVKIYFKLIKILNSDESPGAIARGMCLGLLIALVPFGGLHTPLFLIMLLLLNTSIGAFFLAGIIFLPLKYALNGFFIATGEFILYNDALQPVYSKFFSTLLGAFSRLNNTLVIGSLIWLLPFSLIGFFIFRYLVQKYRLKFQKWYESSLFYKWLNRLNIPSMLAALFIKH